MAKLYFRFGAVKSSKTLNLLAVAHYYSEQNKKVFLIKPKLDNRFGEEYVGSRSGFKRKADLVVSDKCCINPFSIPEDIKCVLIDECQFFTKKQVDQMRLISIKRNIPVIAYGLKTDFKLNLFEGSKRFVEISDVIEEIKNVCLFCEKKATSNALFINGKIQKSLPSNDNIMISTDAFKPLCIKCFYNEIKKVENQDVINDAVINQYCGISV